MHFVDFFGNFVGKSTKLVPWIWEIILLEFYVLMKKSLQNSETFKGQLSPKMVAHFHQQNTRHRLDDFCWVHWTWQPCSVPGTKAVKLLVGPTCKIPRSIQRSVLGNKAINLKSFLQKKHGRFWIRNHAHPNLTPQNWRHFEYPIPVIQVHSPFHWRVQWSLRHLYHLPIW